VRRWVRPVIRGLGFVCTVSLVVAPAGWTQNSRTESARVPAPGAAGDARASSTSPTFDLENRTLPRYASPDLVEASVDPATYILGPQDILALQIILSETRTEQVPVLPEGVVMVPNVGAVPAAGLTLTAFRQRLHAAVAERYRSFEVNCYLAKARQFRVYVTGEVREPGVLAARATDRVSDVVERAGGLGERGSERAIEVRDLQGNVLAHADLAAFRRRGRLDSNPTLAAGNVVFVAARNRTVTVEGAVASPGDYEWVPADDIADVIELAGGLLPTADRSQVSVERVRAEGDARTDVVDLDAGGHPAADVRRIVVNSTLVGQRRVFVVTPEGEQRALGLGAGESLRDLARRVGSMARDADWSHAELSSRDASGRPERVAVDLPRVLNGEGDRPLQDGDVLSVPRLRDYVYVSGFVSRPGRYPYRSDWTVNDYIGEAGGPASGGSTGSVRIYDDGGKSRGADRKSPLQRGETLYLDRSFVSKASSALGLVANLSALVISIVALNR